MAYLYDNKLNGALPLLRDMYKDVNFGPDDYQQRMKGYVAKTDSLHLSLKLSSLSEIIAPSLADLSEEDKELLKLFGVQ
ncbi:hypothetical protein R9C00_25150 [Flammeovirgaceae bacterium SG7u.111]|nr:hypothetical protein [Flammeovirgaceae bacterium SG7u.132]WPO34985.1 hypothetical protein R9C00_25150 [Flammeovirgaceae bacterium SG7u.111]